MFTLFLAWGTGWFPAAPGTPFPLIPYRRSGRVGPKTGSARALWSSSPFTLGIPVGLLVPEAQVSEPSVYG